MTEMPRTATGEDTEVSDEVVKAAREAMRETMDSSIFGNSHDEPAEREYDMAEHVATAAQDALRKEWEEERDEALEEIRESRNDLDLLVDKFCVALGEPIPADAIERAKQLRIARARDAEALTTATEALRKIESAWPDVTVSIALYAQRVLADIERILATNRKES